MRLLALAVLFSSSVVFADIAPMPYSAASELRPIPGADASNLRMAKERVVITLEDGFAVVDATFEMANDGTAKSVKVGFPGEGVYVRGSRAHRALIGFQAFVNGAAVKSTADKQTVTTKKGPPGHEYSKHRDETWHVFDAKFAAKKTTTIRVRYAVLADVFKGDSWGSGDVFADGEVVYVLATGARWSGSIGEAVVVVRSPSPGSVRIRDGKMPPLEKREGDAGVKQVLPSYASIVGGELVITRRSLEPTEDDNLEIVFPLRTPRPDSTVAPELWTDVEARALAAVSQP